MMIQKSKLKICFFFILLIIMVIIIAIFINFNNISNNNTSNKNTDQQMSSELENAKEEYILREDEEFIAKTNTNMNLTQYNGAYYVDGILIVNKTYSLASTYVPNNPYKEINNSYLYGGDYIEKEVMAAFLDMQKDAKNLGYDLYISSGYRSYQVQVDLYNSYVASDGQEIADTYSARPGYSEHQSGLCIDINGTNNNFFATEIGRWVRDNAYKYGFTLRFPEGKEDKTGYEFEPWHYRYVGVELATILYNNGNFISLEEYLGIDSKYE